VLANRGDQVWNDPHEAFQQLVKGSDGSPARAALVTLDPQSSQPACELATPTLSALEWAMRPEKVDLPAEALAQMQELVKAPPKPGARLRAAAKRHSR
jgi:hypothetical protein